LKPESREDLKYLMSNLRVWRDWGYWPDDRRERDILDNYLRTTGEIHDR
jgi:hypothetical protein